jgi:hypothetical protein
MAVLLRFFILLFAALIGTFSYLASAGGPQTNTAYFVDINFTNTICTVMGGPNTLHDFPFIANALVLKTDGAGNISGSGWFWVDYSNAPAYSAFLVDAKGKIASTTANSTPKVTLTIDGPGFTLDGEGHSTPNSIHLKFSGQPGPNPDDTSQMGIVGKLTGTMAGASPLGEKSAAINLETVITDVTFSTLTIQAEVEQTSRQMLLLNVDYNGNSEGNPVFDLTGSGQINHSAQTYRFTAKGIGAEKGWTLTVSGNLGTNTSSSVPGAQFVAPVTAEVTGKVQGQAVSGSTTDIEAELVNGTTTK